MKTLLFGIVVFIFATLIWGVVNLGVFKSVELQAGSGNGIQKFDLLAVATTGAYYKINDILVDLETWAHANGIDCQATFGLFHDDPSFVEEARQRADVGCVILQDQVETVTEKIQQESLQKKHPARMIQLTTEENKTLAAQFNGSPWLGPYKVYAKAQTYFHDHQIPFNFPVMEIYHTKDTPPHTNYLFFFQPPNTLRP